MEVELRVMLPELDQAEAEKLVKVCPFSNAVIGNVDVKLTVVPPSEVQQHQPWFLLFPLDLAGTSR